jgi:hypothetical protein
MTTYKVKSPERFREAAIKQNLHLWFNGNR